jgi:hypothetical protein
MLVPTWVIRIYYFNIYYHNNVFIGIDFISLKMITPGAAPGKDDYWGGADTMKQAKEHLEGLHEHYPDWVTTDVYDNSTGHNCMAPDALVVDKLNLNPGYCRKEELVIRDGYYCRECSPDEVIKQDMRFQPGDTLHVTVQKGAKLTKSSDGKIIVASKDYDTGFVIPPVTTGRRTGRNVVPGSELHGVVKGCCQVLKERDIPFAPSGCKVEGYRRKINEKRKVAVKAFNDDKRNSAAYQALIALPTTEDVRKIVDEIEPTCACARCTLKRQSDFASQ